MRKDDQCTARVGDKEAKKIRLGHTSWSGAPRTSATKLPVSSPPAPRPPVAPALDGCTSLPFPSLAALLLSSSPALSEMMAWAPSLWQQWLTHL